MLGKLLPAFKKKDAIYNIIDIILPFLYCNAISFDTDYTGLVGGSFVMTAPRTEWLWPTSATTHQRGSAMSAIGSSTEHRSQKMER